MQLSTKDHIHRLVNKPWQEDRDLESLYTILVALPLSGGRLGETLHQIADTIDFELSSCMQQKETK